MLYFIPDPATSEQVQSAKMPLWFERHPANNSRTSVCWIFCFVLGSVGVFWCFPFRLRGKHLKRKEERLGCEEGLWAAGGRGVFPPLAPGWLGRSQCGEVDGSDDWRIQDEMTKKGYLQRQNAGCEN